MASKVKHDKPGEGFHIKRQLTVVDGTLLIIGTIIGSGIFISPKGVLLYSGSVGLSLIIWLVCGILSMLGALCMMELGTSIRKFGGDYIYINEAFGPIPSFLYLWIVMVIQKPTSQAIIMLACADYIVYPVVSECNYSPELTKRLIAVVGIIFLTFLNCLNAKWSARFTDILSYSKLIATAIIIGTGIYYLCSGHTESFQNAFDNSTNSIGDISLAMYSGLWAYSGWNNLNGVTEEIKNVKRTLPIALITAVTLITGIYLLVISSYFAVLSPQELLQSDAVAVTFADKTLGVMAWIMPVFVALSTLGATNASVFTAGRVYFSAAREGHLPDVMAMIHVNKCTPIPALLVNGTLSLIMIQVSDINTLISYFSFIEWLGILTSVSGLLWLRFRRPELERPVKLPLPIPILFALLALFLVVVPFYANPMVSLVGLLVTLSGLPVYFAGVFFKRNKPKAMMRQIGSFTRFCQMLLQVCITDYKQ